ncbi:hypothetical protein LZD49_34660 [Dyadobacter sp. CY261]|uniref:hypothetical protein n=1 Tax=Dyadobacter sp. CY261 TaxID=2907203 RepID=UPI001F39E5B1|nr:hypothetical protein [Dyadobacter sp. CY261]MCF0075666.1 hypothetical protein [Dyadobacter sp. CY261]
MRLSICFIVSLILFSSCETDVVVTYEYEGTTIKRVDESDISTFYYGNISEESPKIWAKYSGINDGFSGFLVFEGKGRVKLTSSDGYFQYANIDTSRFYFETIQLNYPKLGKGVYRIKLATRYERRDNENTGSGITATYEE